MHRNKIFKSRYPILIRPKQAPMTAKSLSPDEKKVVLSFLCGMKPDFRKISVENFETSRTNQAFVCNHCNKSYNKLHSIKAHIRSIHRDNKRTFICFTCKRQFANGFNLNRHRNNGCPLQTTANFNTDFQRNTMAQNSSREHEIMN